MKADEKAKYQEEKRIAELEKREKDITVRELKATALETLAEKELPKELAEILNYESAETCNASIEAVCKYKGKFHKGQYDKCHKYTGWFRGDNQGRYDSKCSRFQEECFRCIRYYCSVCACG